MFLLLTGLAIVTFITLLVNRAARYNRAETTVGTLFGSAILAGFIGLFISLVFADTGVGYSKTSSTNHNLEPINGSYAHHIVIDEQESFLIQIENKSSISTISRYNTDLRSSETPTLEVVEWKNDGWSWFPRDDTYILRIPTGDLEISE